MSKSIVMSLFTLLIMLVLGFNVNGQVDKKASSKTSISSVQLIQFHSEHRCKTCNLIEKLARETAKKYPKVTFMLVNVDERKNEKLAEQFEAAGTALFLYDTKTGKKKDMTDFAFMNARTNEKKFISGLSKEIKTFLK